jgi:hypothetical protein
VKRYELLRDREHQLRQRALVGDPPLDRLQRLPSPDHGADLCFHICGIRSNASPLGISVSGQRLDTGSEQQNHWQTREVTQLHRDRRPRGYAGNAGGPRCRPVLHRSPALRVAAPAREPPLTAAYIPSIARPMRLFRGCSVSGKPEVAAAPQNLAYILWIGSNFLRPTNRTTRDPHRDDRSSVAATAPTATPEDP